MNFLQKLFGRSKPAPRLPVPVPRPHTGDVYTKQRTQAASKMAKERMKLARDPQTHLEILYYLADDVDPAVRVAVANNPSTPVQVSEKLARDARVDVRLALAARLVALLPDLSLEQHAHLYAHAVQALSVLALDEVLKVRLALTSALKDHAYAPPEVVNQLARDVERAVSEPILSVCLKLTDDDLIDILSEHPQSWVMKAISNRQKLSGKVTRALVEKMDAETGTALLANPNAELDEDTLAAIVERAKTTPEWHKPLCLRKHLPAQILREIILFVDSKLQQLIFKRVDIDDELRVDLQTIVQRRVRFLTDDGGARIAPDDKLIQLFHTGKLDETAIADAMALREQDFVFKALSLKSGLNQDIVQRMMGTRSGKAVTALAWKAGLSMRFALELQKTLGRVAQNELVYPKDGTDYPLDYEALNWQINFFKDKD